MDPPDPPRAPRPSGRVPAARVERRAFLDAVPRLFASVHGRERQAYEDAIYRAHVPLDEEQLRFVFAFVGAPAPPAEAVARLAPLLAEIRFPRVDPLPPLVDSWGIEPVTAALHFHHPAFPILRPAAWKGAQELELLRAGPFPERARFKEAYLDYLYAVDVLKEELRFFQVPESNCFLARVVEASLTGLGETGNR